MEQPNFQPGAESAFLAVFIEKEVELHYFDNYTGETADRKYLASCQRINNCSCNCNRCGFVIIS